MRDRPHDAIYVAATWYIRQHCMREHEWHYTRLSDLHDGLVPGVSLEPGELPVVSCYIDRDRWFLMTSARLISYCFGSMFAVSPLEIEQWSWGDFKTGLKQDVGTAGVQMTDGTVSSFKYETGYASMAPIHYARFWLLKYPILDKLDINRLRTQM